MSAMPQDAPSEPKHSDWLLVDQAMIDRFADAIHDHQFIHTDPEMAKNGPYGGTIAHGFLGLSLLTHFTRSALPSPEDGVVEINYGFEKVRFLAPVPVGAKLRGVFGLLSSEAKGDGEVRRIIATVEIEGQTKPAVVAEWLVYVVKGKKA